MAAAKGRLKMKREERAKQFAPFAALKGYEEALEEKERIVVRQFTLTEDEKDALDRTIHIVEDGDMVNVVYLKDDDYLKIEGIVSRIDFDARILKIVYTKIPFADIYELEVTEKRKI